MARRDVNVVVAVAASFQHLCWWIQLGPHSAWGIADRGAVLLDGRDGNIPAAV